MSQVFHYEFYILFDTHDNKAEFVSVRASLQTQIDAKAYYVLPRIPNCLPVQPAHMTKTMNYASGEDAENVINV